jgi:integrase
VPSASEYRRKQGPARSVGRPCATRAFAADVRWCSGPQVSDIAYHASPIPRLWPCSSSEGRTPRKETGSVFGAAGCCSTSAAVRCELSRPRLWESLLPSFTVAIVAGLLKNIANQHTLNRDTVTKIRSILSGIFTYAMSEGHFPGRNALENPASRARIPESAVERVEPKAAARDEVKVILTTLKDMPLERAAVAVVAMLGVRPGEARGLRWENWDRVKEQIAVRRAVWHTIEGTPKTTQSVRFLPVSGELREVLLALWKKQKSPVGGYILAAPSGKPVPVILDNLAKRSIRPRLVAVNKEAASRGGIRYADSTEPQFVRSPILKPPRELSATRRRLLTSTTSNQPKCFPMSEKR